MAHLIDVLWTLASFNAVCGCIPAPVQIYNTVRDISGGHPHDNGWRLIFVVEFAVSCSVLFSCYMEHYCTLNWDVTLFVYSRSNINSNDLLQKAVDGIARWCKENTIQY